MKNGMDKKRILALLKPHRRKLAVFSGLSLLMGLCTAMASASIAHLLAMLMDGADFQAGEAAPYLAVLLFALVLRSVLAFPASLQIDATAFAVKGHIRKSLHRLWLRQSSFLPDTAKSGEVLTLCLETVDGLDGFLRHFLPQMLETAVLLPLFFVLALFTDAWTALIFVLTLPIAPFLLYLIGSVTRRTSEKQWQELLTLTQEFSELLYGMTVLKIFGRSAAQRERVKELSQKFSDASLAVLRIAFASSFLLELITTLAIALVAVSLGLRLLDDRIAFEQAFFLLLLAPEFYRPVRQGGIAFHKGIEAKTAAVKLSEFLRHKEQAAYPGKYVMPTQMPPSISLQHVSYSYPGAQEAVLNDLTLTIPAGKFLVLAGASGSGKSTLLRLLAKMAEPSEGKILINDLPLKDIAPDSWQEKCMYVPQEPHLFQGTLRENVTLFAEGISDEHICRALRQASLGELLQRNQALDLRLGEGFHLLSAGQRRRLGLARAFCRDA